MQIRPATAGDVDAMAGVWLRSALTAYADIFPADAPKPTHASLVDLLGDHPGFVADDGRIVGLVQAFDGRLTRLYVDPEYWGRRIGARLHDAAVDALRAQGTATAALWVLRENKRARAMYERRGWVLTDDTRPVYEPAGIVDVRYERTL